MGKPLNDRQQRFVEEYLVDRVARLAAIRAGYSEKTAHAQAHKLLKHAEVAKAIGEITAKKSTELGFTATDVLNELQVAAFAPLGEIDWKNKLRALELLGRYFKLFVDRIQVEDLAASIDAIHESREREMRLLEQGDAHGGAGLPN